MNCSIYLALLLFVSIAYAESQTNSVAAPKTSTNGAPLVVTSTNLAEQVDAKYRALLEMDDSAVSEIQNLLKKREAQQGSATPERTDDELGKMIRFRIDSVKKAYQKFLLENPQHVKAMIAYGSFLCDVEEEQEGIKWWLKAEEVDPKNAAVRNNLANFYTHHAGEAKHAIEEYESAISLQPGEPLYYFNLANAMYLFRKETGELKKWTEAEVFDHALEYFRKARDLEPNNYDYAYAYAETFYGVKHANWQRALDAWNYCLKLNLTPLQRDQIYTHLARIHINLGNLAKARDYLARVQSEQWQDLRQRLTEIAKHQEDVARANESTKADTPKAK